MEFYCVGRYCDFDKGSSITAAELFISAAGGRVSSGAASVYEAGGCVTVKTKVEYAAFNKTVGAICEWRSFSGDG